MLMFFGAFYCSAQNPFVKEYVGKHYRDFSEFEQSIKEFPEVISCHLVSGNFDYYLNVISEDVESYNRFYQEKLAVLPSVAHISSLFVMDEIKTTTSLPL